MTDAQVHMVLQSVESYLRGPHGQGFDIGNPQHFKRLVAYVRPHVGAVAEDNLCVVVAMCVLGPGTVSTTIEAGKRRFHGAWSIPPAALQNELLDIVRHYVPPMPERLARVMEFAIAYGCGKWHTGHPKHGGWGQRWEGAQCALARAVEPAVAHTNRWLAAHVVGFLPARDVPHHSNVPEDTAVWSDAWLLAIRLTRAEYPLSIGSKEVLRVTCTQDGTALVVPSQDYQHTIPAGAKAVWTVADGHRALALSSGTRLVLPTGSKVIVIARDEDAIIRTTRHPQAQLKVGEVATLTGPTGLAVWECTCGTTPCRERHRLEAWDPTHVTLWAFVGSAIKGPQPTLKAVSFTQGMYFPLLTQEWF